ncbi:hypothetical protein OAB94_01830 [Flavobacteriaceae bacterium]|nr:hypothetical protein [Flavobacteriaceae bacterium]MDB9980476.1 hypothetical protein [bacterium]
MDIERLVYNMLTENTGKHFLDSGGDSGRMWQRNASLTLQNFKDVPEEEIRFDFTNGWFERNVSVFHYLTNNLELDNICDNFNMLQDDPVSYTGEDCMQSNYDIYGVTQRAMDYLEELNDVHCDYTFNTYNGDSDLSQILQGTWIRLNDHERYLVLQIHNGADARGGYTNAKLFKIDDMMEMQIHEYLEEYVSSDEIAEDLHHFINGDVSDSNDSLITYTTEQIQSRLDALKNELTNK